MPLSNIKVIEIDTNRRAVRFSAYNGEGTTNCAVSFEAMDDAERARSVKAEDREAQFARLQGRIVEAAARNYFSGHVEANGEVLVKTADLTAVPKGLVD